MVNNAKVVLAFKDGKLAKSKSMTSLGDKLLSYGTVICEKCNDKYYYNNTHYSNSTSKHQSIVKSLIPIDVELNNINRGTKELVRRENGN